MEHTVTSFMGVPATDQFSPLKEETVHQSVSLELYFFFYVADLETQERRSVSASAQVVELLPILNDCVVKHSTT